MKNLILHSVPVIISMIWLNIEKQTFNPVILKGPDFLKFYMILLSGTCLVAFLLKRSTANFPKTTLYFFFFILVLGLIKLIRGINLGKPIGFLVMIMIVEVIIILIIIYHHINHKIKD
ncbi:MAG: hypothetical protein LBE92_01655 [Chryseobacterium sp.]|uniref:hypothetical protein n=1 Tax=Chryseobacterium sp. TaxID=1871047 RepID=UPI002825FC12|nr:hypothetical protein [Chryseobacterium sp.]MDR2234803.1 hypothetical protein [Chryseobacterium sp.]